MPPIPPCPPPPVPSGAPPCPPLPRPPRNDGPLLVSESIDAKDTMGFLYEQMFIHAPATEPFKTSFARLVEAIRADGYGELCPTTVFIVYRRHPELGYLTESSK